MLNSFISNSRFRVGELATLKRKSSLFSRRLAVPRPAADARFEMVLFDFAGVDSMLFISAFLLPDDGGGSSSVGVSPDGGKLDILP